MNEKIKCACGGTVFEESKAIARVYRCVLCNKTSIMMWDILGGEISLIGCGLKPGEDPVWDKPRLYTIDKKACFNCGYEYVLRMTKHIKSETGGKEVCLPCFAYHVENERWPSKDELKRFWKLDKIWSALGSLARGKST